MSQTVTKLPINKSEQENTAGRAVARADAPLEALRQQIDRLFDNFGAGFWRHPLRHSLFGSEPLWRDNGTGIAVPAVDMVEKDKAYEITAELPGLNTRDIEVTLSNGILTIKGEKTEEKEEKKKDYYLSERSYGSFMRNFRVPEGADAEKIEATYDKGILKLTVPKTAEAQKPEKKIAIKAA